MPYRCFVFGCKSGYSNKSNKGKNWHFFAPPKNNPELFSKWQQMCFRNKTQLTNKSRICHEHFTDEHVIKGRTFVMSDGLTYTYPYKQWKLVDGAYPSVFMNTTIPGRLRKKNSKHQKPPTDHSAIAADEQAVSRSSNMIQQEPEKELANHSADSAACHQEIADARVILQMSYLKSLFCTLPLNLIIRHHGSSGNYYGVWCKEAVTEGMRFGPYEAITSACNIKHLKDSYSQGKALDKKEISSNQDELILNWLAYINCTSDMEQQNLIMYEYLGQIFCISTKCIPAGTELLVWHSDKPEKGTISSSTNDGESSVESLGDNILNSSKTTSAAALLDVEKCPQMAEAYNSLQHATQLSLGLCKEKSSKKFEDRIGSITHLTQSQTLKEMGHYQCSHCQKSFTQLCVFKVDDNYLAPKASCKHCGNIDKLKHPCVHAEKQASDEYSYHCNVPNVDAAGKKLTELQDQFKSHKPKNKLSVHSKLQNFAESQEKMCDHNVHNDKSISRSKIIALERIHGIEKTFECNLCNKKFIASSSLEVHLRNHILGLKEKNPLEEKVYVLKILNKDSATSNASLIDLKCTEEKPNAEFKTKLSEIIKSYAEGKQYKYGTCDTKFQIKFGFMEHQYRGKKPHLCETCGKTFHTNSKLKQHRRVHTGEKPYACSFCGKAFITRPYLRNHERIHTGEKPFECQVCNKKFSTRSAQCIHKTIHTKEKPFQCDTCNMKFRLQCQLKKHRTKHSTEKLFECSVCKKSFKQMRVLNAHIKTHERPFECELCNKKYPSKYNLKMHQMLHYGKTPFECDLCKKKFATMRYLKQHLVTHIERPYMCNACDKKFSTEKSLLLHKSTHINQKLFTCDLCNKKYISRNSFYAHRNSHITEKPFECDMCSKKFSSINGLFIHKRIHGKKAT